MIDLTPVLQAVIALIAVLISTFVIPYIKNKTTNEKQAEIALWIGTAVLAAEQIYKGFGRGYEKKEYVKNFLLANGYIADLDTIASEIDALIEAAVYELKHQE